MHRNPPPESRDRRHYCDLPDRTPHDIEYCFSSLHTSVRSESAIDMIPRFQTRRFNGCTDDKSTDRTATYFPFSISSSFFSFLLSLFLLFFENSGIGRGDKGRVLGVEYQRQSIDRWS
ncbi:hypothetical protein AWENTII_008372 [Aspergillus wentii]